MKQTPVNVVWVKDNTVGLCLPDYELLFDTETNDMPPKGEGIVTWIGRHLTDIDQSLEYLTFVQDDSVDHYALSVKIRNAILKFSL